MLQTTIALTSALGILKDNDWKQKWDTEVNNKYNFSQIVHATGSAGTQAGLLAGKKYFNSKTEITGAQLYSYCNKLAKKYGWEFGGEIAGHIIGQYPHEKLEKEDKTNYIHPENHTNMFDLNKEGEKKNWILEIHFVDKEKEIGGFFEQLLA